MFVATGLWPVCPRLLFTLGRRSTGPWLQRLRFYLKRSSLLLESGSVGVSISILLLAAREKILQDRSALTVIDASRLLATDYS